MENKTQFTETGKKTTEGIHMHCNNDGTKIIITPKTINEISRRISSFAQLYLAANDIHNRKESNVKMK